MKHVINFPTLFLALFFLAGTQTSFAQWGTSGTNVSLTTATNDVGIGTGGSSNNKVTVFTDNNQAIGISIVTVGTATAGIRANTDASYGADFRGVIGVRGYTTSTGGYGVYGEEISCSSCYAGYFSGDVTVTGTFSNPSDRKFKSGIQPLGQALDKIMQLRPSLYQFRTTEFNQFNFPQGVQPGLIADEVATVLPELVIQNASPAVTNEDGTATKSVEYESVNYVGMIPYLVAGMQEQQGQIKEKDAQIAALELRLAKLEARLGEVPTERVMVTTTTEASVLANRPNPFSEATTIDFTVPQNARQAQLLIVDASGKVVLQKELAQRGAGNIEVNMKALSTGTYYYYLDIDGTKTASQKMLLQK